MPVAQISLAVDVSDIAIEIVLQKTVNGIFQLLTFSSRKLTLSEQRHKTILPNGQLGTSPPGLGSREPLQDTLHEKPGYPCGPRQDSASKRGAAPPT